MEQLLHQTGLLDITPGNIVMIITGMVLLYLGIVKKYEPFLLVGIGFSCIVANIPGSTLTKEGGLFWYSYQGVENLILPPLIFLGVGAMTDFGPMIANPSLVIFGGRLPILGSLWRSSVHSHSVSLCRKPLPSG